MNASAEDLQAALDLENPDIGQAEDLFLIIYPFKTGYLIPTTAVPLSLYSNTLIL
jgi:hypothetical protein